MVTSHHPGQVPIADGASFVLLTVTVFVVSVAIVTVLTARQHRLCR